MLRQLALFSGILATLLAATLVTRAQAQDEPPGRKLAFLVGVKQYDHGDLKDLDFPENDVEDLAAVLQADGFQAVVLTTARGTKNANSKPTAENIRTRLKTLLKGTTKRDLIIVALAGHGLQPIDSDDSYFCPADASPIIRNGKPVAPQRLVSIGEILADLADCGIGEKLLLVDACRNDPSARSARRRGLDHVNVAALPARTGVLLSCSQGEFSFEEKSLGNGHGVFFYHVIEGLKGAAKDNQGDITWDELAIYVRAKVPPTVQKLFGKDGAEQSPNAIGNLRGVPTVLARVTAPGNQNGTNSIDMTLRLIPAGEFLMGGDQSPDEVARLGGTKPEFFAKEQPRHKVRITTPFQLGAYEVTQAQFQTVMGRNPSAFSASGGRKAQVEGEDTSRFPVETVTWFDAIEFCNKFSEKDNLSPYYGLTNIERADDGSVNKADVVIQGGNGYRLPTEAEWEYACRAGTTTAFHFGPVCNGKQANIDGSNPYGTAPGNFLGRPTTVGLYRQNAFEIYDMHGNALEWCWDFYGPDFYTTSPTADPTGPSSGKERMLRGGSWYSPAKFTRSAFRLRRPPATRGDYAGFRVARTP